MHAPQPDAAAIRILTLQMKKFEKAIMYPAGRDIRD